MKHHIIGFLLILCIYTSGRLLVLAQSTTRLPKTISTFTDSSDDSSTTSTSSASNCSIDAAFPSFTLVMDTTGSMGSYLILFQNIARNLATRLEASSANVTRQYTLMEFNDPNVGPVHITCSPTEFFNYLYSLYAYNWGSCQESSMSGLLTALQNSPFGSFVLLVSDASAEDSGDTYIVNQIYSLLDSLQVKVFLFVGSCWGTDQSDYQIYKDIAARSYGLVFPINYLSSSVPGLLNFFLKIPVNSTTRLFSVDNNNGTSYSASFSVPSGLNSLVISISGSVYSFTLYHPSGSEQVPSTFFSESWASVYHLDNPSSGTWSFNCNGSGSYSLRIEGYNENGVWGDTYNSSAFCATCDSNAICKKDLLDYTCVCKKGFSGDGFYCYDVDECSYYGYGWYSSYVCGSNGYCVNTYGSYYCNCYGGYTFNNITCVDVDECSSPSLNGCDPAAVCLNYGGSYSCYCPEGYYGNGYKCEVDECTRDVCGFGRECIKSTGSHNCTDPCFTYTTLNDPTRSTSYRDFYYYYYYYYYYGRSDYYLSGWYRFMGSGGVRLADFCPSDGSCYTRFPMWLEGTHPNPSDGIVNRTVSTSYYGYCRQYTSDVKIKACPGGFYVYKFKTPPVYYSAYCTDPNTVPESCACTAEEECREVDGHYGCHCKDDGTTTMNDIRPVLSCGNQEIKASFQKCALLKFNLNTTNVHLKDSYCTGFPDFNTTNIISVVSILKNGVCGNKLVNNGTHVIYKNSIFIPKDTGASFGADDVLEFDVSCVYPLDMQLSLDTALRPFVSSSNIYIEGTGMLQATMALYKDSSYTSPYEGSEVLLTSKTNLFIGILLKTADVSQYALLIKNCYATSSRNSTDRYDIIKDSCPSKQDSSINVIQNGASVHGQFSLQLFGYVKDLKVAYLHCDIHLCNSSCTPTCIGSRALRTTDSLSTDASLTLGPIVRQDDTSFSANGGADYLVASLATVFLLLSGTLLFAF